MNFPRYEIHKTQPFESSTQAMGMFNATFFAETRRLYQRFSVNMFLSGQEVDNLPHQIPFLGSPDSTWLPSGHSSQFPLHNFHENCIHHPWQWIVA